MSSRPDLQNIEDVVDGADGAESHTPGTVAMSGFGVFDDDDLGDDDAGRRRHPMIPWTT